jgi:Fe-S oxidoreductase
VTHRETYTPHAWALTLESVKRGPLEWSAETVDVLFACADCGLCQSHCVTDQPLPDAIVQAREGVVSAGRAPSTVAVLRDRLIAQQHPYAVTAAPASAPGHGAIPSAGSSGSVALFVGDAAHHLTPSVVEAALVLLEAAGVRVVTVGVGRSSGWIASSTGLRDVALGLARGALDEIARTGASEVLTLSTADRWAFEHVYPARLGLPLPAGLVVNEVVAVLAEAVAGGRLRFRKQAGPPYAYHDPCHSVRVSRNGAAPRRLLTEALGEQEGRALFWREGRAHPCGAIGGLELTHPEIAKVLAEARLADTKAAGALRLITDDPSCAYHLNQAETPGVLVEHLFDVLVPLCVR